MKNTHNRQYRDRSTKKFRLLGSPTSAEGPWQTLLEANLEDSRQQRPPPIKQLMPPPFRLPDLPIIDKASGLINGVGKLDLRGRTAEDNEKQPVQQQSSEDGLVMMTILPDEKGRFGFNVKGGADQKMPIIVSRVGVNTPADRYILEKFKFFTIG